MIVALDHAVVAVRDLDAAAERTAALYGRPPSWRGTHPGAGTANALFRLDNAYVELLAPEGDGPLGRSVAARLDERGDGLAALAFATDDAEATAAALRARGLAVAEPAAGEGRSDEGAVRRWRSVFLPLAATRGIPVFAIEHESPEGALPLREPSARASSVAALDHVVVTSADLDASRRVYGETLSLRLALDRTFEERGLRILFFRVAGVTVEVAGRARPGASADAVDAFGGLAYRVADADAARERIAGAGFDVSPVRDGAKPGTRVCTVRGDPCGVPTLIIEPAGRYPGT